MSNTHEYVVFDRAKLDIAISMRWPAFDKAYRGWGQWESAKEFLVEWALNDELQIASVDEILARKTVRATMAMSDDPFHFLSAILDTKNLSTCSVDVEKGDYHYGDDIVSCAGAAFSRGDLSLASLTAVCHLHAGWFDMDLVLLPDIASAVLEQPDAPCMLPGFFNMMSGIGNGIGVTQTRKVIDFLLRAWRERWPLQAEGQTTRNGKSIRSCTVANELVRALRKRRLSKPCIFHWYEC